ncbi:MAG: hypothetical protein HYT03_01530 [Candidatus Harrisonbacteria bacterium]|nr:hypothetical protein [Candidatus Harrisonbacteria bacterium]
MKARRNKSHPELRDGEVFLTNASDDDKLPTRLIDYAGNYSDWESIGWRTKRRGVVAYDIYGRPVPEMFPVFVQRNELIRGGIYPDKL